jgi:hypothetical protein
MRRAPKLPPDVRSQLELSDKERILAWIDDGNGRLVIASETALHLQRNPPAYSRFSWDQIENASYESDVMTITLIPELDSASLRVPVGQDPRLPVAVRDRVTASVVVDRFVPLEGDRGVRIIGRRGDHGAIAWRTDLDPALSGRPDLLRLAEQSLAEVQGEVSAD